MSSTAVSTTSDMGHSVALTPDTPVKNLVSFDKDGGIQVLDDEVLELIAGGQLSANAGGLLSEAAAAARGNGLCIGHPSGNNGLCIDRRRAAPR